MRLPPLSGMAVCSLAILLPQAGLSQDAADSRLYLTAGTETARVHLAADQILREDPPDPGPSPYASVVRLKGNVEIRTCCVQLSTKTASRRKPHPRAYMVMHADEADYHSKTGEIEARGTVRVTFQPQ